LAQEVFLRLLKLDRVHLIRNPRAYLFRVASSVIADYGRRRSRRPSAEPWIPEVTELADREPDPFERCQWSQRLERIQSVINDLPERCQRALILHRRDGWTYEEIALELEVSRSMVKKYLRRALILCRRALDEEKPTGELAE
jgi:RNA polymerase sigma-70 factor (ECF subfamily)